MASMEHPIFSLSTKPDHRTRRYEHGSVFIEIAPSAQGLATVHDRDILIYCISQLMASLNDGKPLSSVVRFKAHDLLRATNRVTSGEGYTALKAALERLRGTQISTNIVTGGTETFEVFGLIERAKVVRETREGRMQEVEIKLSDWVFNAIQSQEVLTLHRDYFRLRKPLERRMYELARKHCGKQQEWKISLQRLQHKCGSCSTEKEFRRLVSNIVEEDQKFGHMPDYSVMLDDSDIVTFRSRGSVPSPELPFEQIPLRGLDPEVYNHARSVAPGWDVYFLEREWREWLTEPPRDPEAAFIGFCKKRAERSPHP
ncbi:Replication initiator protein A [Caulifigura coniformis]|uniref:Replication initiator protein A n=2 Tax=Caulifigura coniformis TaxID=2527983 RepID=A0A517SCN8_9PLAN|nr:Replication initiator protein A [Caulifigura coniformis]